MNWVHTIGLDSSLRLGPVPDSEVRVRLAASPSAESLSPVTGTVRARYQRPTVTGKNEPPGQCPQSSAAAAHDEAKLISKTRPEKHTKHCVLEKDSLNPLHFAK